MPDTSAVPANRESKASATFVALVDSLVEDFDVIDLLTVLSARCVELLDAAAAGILLADANGSLRVMAASTEQIELLELFQVQNQQGPCLDCYHTGTVVVAAQLDEASPWPEFAKSSVAAGYSSVCAVPLRLRATVLGCLNLFMSHPGALSQADIDLAQALADVASIAIVQAQASRDAAEREGQLQNALNSRVIIEQAKGMLAEHADIDMDGAFTRLRSYSRRNNRRLTDIALELVAGTLPVNTVATAKI